MTFQSYLISTIETANMEKSILDELSQNFDNNDISPANYRAAERSLQILTENMIGKFKKILKHYGCPVIPNRAYDALEILVSVGILSDEDERFYKKVIGFRNALVHDYMDFDRNLVKAILVSKDYLKVYDFLLQEPKLSDLMIKRLENYSL